MRESRAIFGQDGSVVNGATIGDAIDGWCAMVDRSGRPEA